MHGVIDEEGGGGGTTVDERSRAKSVLSSEAVKSTTATTDGRGGSSPNPGAILAVAPRRELLPFSLRDLGTIFIRNVCVFSPLARPRASAPPSPLRFFRRETPMESAQLKSQSTPEVTPSGLS